MSRSSHGLQQALNQALSLAIERQRAGDVAGAEALYLKVLEQDMANALALHNLALIRKNQGDFPLALEMLQAAVQLRPDEAAFHYNLAHLHQEMENLTAAAQSYQQAIRLNPGHRAALENLGVVLQDQGNYQAAETTYRQALELEPCAMFAHMNLITVLRAQGRSAAALQQCDKGLDCEPAHVYFHTQKAAITLMQGNYAQGWPLREWRYFKDNNTSEADPPHQVPLTKWEGSSLQGKGIVVCGEGGIGDEILHASCIPDLARLAGRILLVCAPRLVPLFARSFPGIEIRAAENHQVILNREDHHDYHLIGSSLPLYLRPTAKSFSRKPYLQADPAAVSRWQERLAALGNRPRIGISWRGGMEKRTHLARSLSISQLAPLLALDGYTFIDVQYGSHEDDLQALAALGVPLPVVLDDCDPLHDMDDFAALLSALDLLISIDNSTVHLAGALGVATWALLPANAHWYWQEEGEDSIWYESVRLWRQQGHGEAARNALVQEIIRELDTGKIPVSSLPNKQPAPGIAVQKSLESSAPRALLLNDTSYWYHWGCTGTSLALHQGLREAGFVVEGLPITTLLGLERIPGDPADFDSEEFFAAFSATHPEVIAALQRSDRVLVNGEGSLHGTGHMAIALLYLMHVAKHWLRKPTEVVNHSCYPADALTRQPEQALALYRKVYAGLDRIVVREAYSARILQDMGLVAEQGFDCLPLFIASRQLAPQKKEKRIVIAGTVALNDQYVAMMVQLAEQALAEGYQLDVLIGANAWLAEDDIRFTRALHPCLRGRYQLIAATNEQQWLTTIQRASLLISGHFHHTIAAACLQTPFLVSASNTDKIAGLLEQLHIASEYVWIDPHQPQQAGKKLHDILQQPRHACISDTTLQNLQQQARTNFPQPS